MTRKELDGAELIQRRQLLAAAFRPSAPVSRRDLFAGRTEQLAELFAVVAQPGQHAVVFGERGVGKTSLAAVASETLRSSNLLTARATCDTSDDFASVWRKALDDVVLRTPQQSVGFASAPWEKADSAASLLGSQNVTPNAVRKALHRLTRQRELVVFVDEFDRLRDGDARTFFADTIKTLSDQLVDTTIVLVGVADDVGELIREHVSIERALAQIHMPRMTRSELEEIVTKGVALAGMSLARRTAERIATLSQGLPHYTHLLAQLAAQAALEAGRTEVRLADVEEATKRAIARAQQTISDAYQEAVAGTRRTLYPDVLLACALAESDEYGSFAPADVRAPLAALAGRPYEARAFSKHLDTLADGARGPVLQKRGDARTTRYRFANPLLQPYVVLRGVSEGRLSAARLR